MVPGTARTKATIIEVIGRNIADGRLAGQIESVEEQGGRMIVGFRPEKQDGWPLDNGIRYMVLTMGDGKITEMKGCPDRKTALTSCRRTRAARRSCRGRVRLASLHDRRGCL
jgi:hypothetical protein